MTVQQPRASIPFGEAFRFWLKLGFISFGGRMRGRLGLGVVRPCDGFRLARGAAPEYRSLAKRLRG